VQKVAEKWQLCEKSFAAGGGGDINRVGSMPGGSRSNDEAEVGRALGSFTSQSIRSEGDIKGVGVALARLGGAPSIDTRLGH